MDVTVTLDAAPEREVTIPITATDQDGASAWTTTPAVPASVIFGVVDTSKSFTFSAAQDAVDDDGERVKLAFGTLPAQVTGGTTGRSGRLDHRRRRPRIGRRQLRAGGPTAVAEGSSGHVERSQLERRPRARP